MKNLKSLLPVVIIALTAGFTSCGSDDDPSEQTPKVVNVNANDGKANVYTARMEFPNVSSPKVRVLVNSTSDYGVNYSVGWDDELKSQRYSCYAMYNGNSVPVHITKAVEEVRRLEDRVLVPYTKAICQFHVRQIPETVIAEAAPEEIYAQSSERGAGKLGSSGK